MNPVRDSSVHYVYVLQSKKTSKWYTGYTSDLRKRFREHQEGKSTWTRGKGPWKLIYYEACLNEQDAITREAYLKSTIGKRYLRNRLKRFLSLTG
jgi:putative endonuclease